MNDLVSVIVPVYNVEAFLRRCLDSIIGQTYTNLEIILVDDGSTDSSSIICDEYLKKDKRIKVIHKANGGLSDARNAGIDIMTGEYVTFIDSDDWVEIDYVEYLLQLIMDNNADLSICDFNYIDKNNNLFNTPCNDGYIYLWNQKDALKMLLDGKKIETSSTGRLYISSFFKEKRIRFPFGRLFEDIPVTYKVILCSEKICFGNRALYNYFYRPGSISTMSFSPQRLHCLEHLDDAFVLVLKKYPELENDCKIASFRMNFGIIPCFDRKKENKKYRDLVVQNVKKNRISVITSRDSTIEWKIKALMTYLGIPLVKKIFSK